MLATSPRVVSILLAVASLVVSALAIYADSRWKSVFLEYSRHFTKMQADVTYERHLVGILTFWRTLAVSLSPVAFLAAASAFVPFGPHRRPCLTLAIPALLVSLMALPPALVGVVIWFGGTF